MSHLPNRLPTEMDFDLTPPPQLMWMERQFHPRIKDGLRFKDGADSAIRLGLALGSQYFPLGIRDTAIRYAPDRYKTPFVDEIQPNDLVLEVSFCDPNIVTTACGKNILFYRMLLPLDGRLYIVPYLFTICKIKTTMFGGVMLESIHVIPERWKKLRDMNIIENLNFDEMQFAGSLPIQWIE